MEAGNEHGAIDAEGGSKNWSTHMGEDSSGPMCQGQGNEKGNPKFQEHIAWHVCVGGTRNRAVEGTASLWTAQLRVCLLMDQSLLSVKGELS